jgi:xanthine dehydrogenase accessory factor
MREAGVPDKNISSLVCPIGVQGIKSKHPAAIAAATAAQLLEKDELLRTEAIPLTGAVDLAKVSHGRRAS